MVEKPKLFTEAKRFFNSGTIRLRCAIYGMIEEANDAIFWTTLTREMLKDYNSIVLEVSRLLFTISSTELLN